MGKLELLEVTSFQEFDKVIRLCWDVFTKPMRYVP